MFDVLHSVLSTLYKFSRPAELNQVAYYELSTNDIAHCQLTDVTANIIRPRVSKDARCKGQWAVHDLYGVRDSLQKMLYEAFVQRETLIISVH